MTPGLFGVLVLIESNAGMNQTDLARTSYLDRSTVVNVIDNLEIMKLAERRAVDGDRRSKALFLTSTGKALLQELKRQVVDHEKRATRDLTPAGRRQLVNLGAKNIPQTSFIVRERIVRPGGRVAILDWTRSNSRR